VVYIKNFIKCFVIFTFSFGILIFAVSENIKIGLVGGIIASFLYSIRIIISERTVDKYKIPPIKKELEKSHQVLLYGQTILLGNKGKPHGSRVENNKGGALFLLETGVYFREIILRTSYEMLIEYCDIEGVQKGGVQNKVLQINLKNGGCERFTIEQREIWITKIQELVDVEEK